jgi:hypothetical protein
MPVNNDSDDERQGSGTSSKRLQPHEVSVEEYNDLAKRLDTMEASVGFVLNKVRRKKMKKIVFLDLRLI